MTRVNWSPIEVMMRNGIVLAASSQNVHLYDFSTMDGAYVRLHEGRFHDVIMGGEPEEWGSGADATAYWILFGDVRISSYRVDLVLQIGDGIIAIECDGHDWHDRTKQQAAYDRSRDRELLRWGIPTLRFTGSEIHHSIDRCVDDVYQIGRRADLCAEALRDAETVKQDERYRIADLVDLLPSTLLIPEAG